MTWPARLSKDAVLFLLIGYMLLAVAFYLNLQGGS